ncbi:MAG: tyrosine-type recombinase/integrase [Candidatus Poribacteria bacterium]|nr:tyrosine-type recombinase/integrase [Candidatus Poribacteria bacterium]
MKNDKLDSTQTTAIVPSTETTVELIPEPTARLVEKSFAENTLRNRRHALEKFDEWLRGRPITDGLLAQYITNLFNDGKAPGTISIVVAAVKWLLKHRNNGQPIEMPITSATLSGIRREGRDRGRGQRNGLTWREVEKICAVQEADGSLRGIRNSAILRVMSDGLLRISEVTELRIDDLEDNTLRIRFSKTDQEGEGEYLYLCEDTRQIVQKWLKRSELAEGYLFRRMTARGDNLYVNKDTGEPYALTADGVRKIIKRAAAKVGIADKISGHSLRIGTTVSLAQLGASLVDIQTAGRWKDPGMPAHYARAQFAERGAIARFKDGKR